MLSQPVVIQAITLVAVVLFFDMWERLRPGHPVNKRRFLWIDVLAIAVVMVFGELVKVPIRGGIDALGFTAEQGYVAPLSGLPLALKLLLAVAAADFGLYWMHRAMHASDLLWNTHRFHHSITELYWLSGSRTSVTHLFLFALTQTTIAFLVFGLTPAESSIALSFGVAVNIWVHTNIKVDLGPLQWLVITPDYHRIHHAADQRSRMNLGFVFTLWDRAFGTYIDPRSVEEEFALGSAEPDKGLARQIAGF